MSDRLRDVTSQPRPTRGFGAWIGGRANRKEYWLWVAPLFVVGTAVEMVAAPFGQALIALPLLFTWIRRLHDLGRSGWWAPVINIALTVLAFGVMTVIGSTDPTGLTSLFGLIALIGLGIVPGQAHGNEFGPPPGRADLEDTFA